MENSLLFPEPELPIEPAADRPDPAIWIERLTVVEELAPSGSTIREIEFRRGLNIIRTAKRPEGESRTVGHSVGKSLLLRLIRYCLGEHGYCTRATRAAITNVYPDAYVLALVHVQGTPWVVARPVGLDSSANSSRALEGSDFSLIRDEDGPARKYGEFLAAIDQAVSECFAALHEYHGKRVGRWLDLLGWLARDQTCRYRRHHEWRDPDAEAQVGQLTLEEASLLIRSAMGLLNAEEAELRGKHQQMLKARDDFKKERDRLAMFMDMREAELRRALRLDEDVPSGEGFISHARDAADQLVQRLRRLLDDQKNDEEVSRLEAAYTEAANALAVAASDLERVKAEQEAENTLIESLEAKDQQAVEAAIEQLGRRYCDLFQTKKEADDAGCPGKSMRLDVLNQDGADAATQARIEECKVHLSRLDEERKACEKQVTQRRVKYDRAKKIYEQARRTHEKHLAEIGTRIGRCRTHRRSAIEMGGQSKRLQQLDSLVDKQQKAIDGSLLVQQQVREQHDQNRKALSDYFDLTLKKLLGPDTGGFIELQAKGVYPRPNEQVASAGEAIGTSATVLGFDIACLVAGICGVGHLPRLFIHDSPREADMEPQMYHRLFEWVAEVEDAFAGREPNFQYIVTTTTPPPPTLDHAPYVRSPILDARTEEGMLLRRKF